MKLILFLVAVYSLIIRETTLHSKKNAQKQVKEHAPQNLNKAQVRPDQSNKEKWNRSYQNAVVRTKAKQNRQSK